MDIAIQIENLSVSYSKNDALHNISLQINKGDFACIIGPNGGGKTTLLKTILGTLKYDSGKITTNAKGGPLGYVPQTADIDPHFPLNALETVLTAFLRGGLHPFKSFSGKDREKALGFLREMGIETLAQKQLCELSGGEFQRLLIARALALESEILLLDEPTANVDITSRNQIFSLLKKLQKSGKTIIIVTHDIAAATEFGNRLICINQSVIFNGDMPKQEEINRILYGDFKKSGDENV